MDCSSMHKLDNSVDISPSTSSNSAASETSMDLMGELDPIQ